MRRKKLLSVVLAAALTCTCLPIQGIGTVNVFAEEKAASDFTIDENGVLTEYNGNGRNVVIPDSVTSIGLFAFSGCRSLKSISIPNSVTSIGIHAFEDCSSLTSITIPDSVTSFSLGIIKGCDELTTIKGQSGSCAETFANAYGFKFVTIHDDSNNTSNNNIAIMGDFDGNNKADLNDAKTLLKAAVGIIQLTDEQKKAADVNGDGQINLSDAKLLLRIAVGITGVSNNIDRQVVRVSYEECDCGAIFESSYDGSAALHKHGKANVLDAAYNGGECICGGSIIFEENETRYVKIIPHN